MTMTAQQITDTVYIALYYRYFAMGYSTCKTLKQAREILKYGNDYGECMPIAIIEVPTNKMVWFEKYLGKKECKKIMDEFLLKFKI